MNISNPSNERQIVFNFLQNHTATASMISEATGIKQKNICRYKRKLQKSGLLWEVERSKCKITGRQAWYLTTNAQKTIITYALQLQLPL